MSPSFQADPGMTTGSLLLQLDDVEENKEADDEASDDAEFSGTSSSCKVILPLEESIMQADVHPHCSVERFELEPTSLSLSPKGSRCVAKDATVAAPRDDVSEVFLANGAEATDIELLKEDPVEDPYNAGFLAIFSLNEIRGLRAASTADRLTQTLVPFLLLLYPDPMVGAAVLELLLRSGPVLDASEFSLTTAFEL